MLERRALDVALAEVGLGEAALRCEGVGLRELCIVHVDSDHAAVAADLVCVMQLWSFLTSLLRAAIPATPPRSAAPSARTREGAERPRARRRRTGRGSRR